MITLSVSASHIKNNKKTDLLLVKIPEGSITTQLLTKNKFAAAPILIAKKHLSHYQPKYIIINSGNANAATGKQGLENIKLYLKHLAKLAKCKVEEILPYSTGVIGEQLPVNKIINHLPSLLKNLGTATLKDAAQAIMTTDTYPKFLSTSYKHRQKKLTIRSIAKGAGMIYPNMATLIGLVHMNSNLSNKHLKSIFKQAIDRSFNRISVDGDTSTNDSFICIQTTNNSNITDITFITNSLTDHLIKSSKKVIGDGEGATMLVHIYIESAKNEKQAQEVATTIAHSPLVKTALHARDPNWGRLVAAIGNAKTNIYADKVDIYLGKIRCFTKNALDPKYTEKKGQKEFNKKNISITVKLHQGTYSYQFLTCDLSKEYVAINSDYRS